jgi:hypothetical protein
MVWATRSCIKEYQYPSSSLWNDAQHVAWLGPFRQWHIESVDNASAQPSVGVIDLKHRQPEGIGDLLGSGDMIGGGIPSQQHVALAIVRAILSEIRSELGGLGDVRRVAVVGVVHRLSPGHDHSSKSLGALGA